ncbi:hypothetical protein WCLP8_4170003 [uncultured Gammaproteobacteria bacterium]
MLFGGKSEFFVWTPWLEIPSLPASYKFSDPKRDGKQFLVRLKAFQFTSDGSSRRLKIHETSGPEWHSEGNLVFFFTGVAILRYLGCAFRRA